MYRSIVLLLCAACTAPEAPLFPAASAARIGPGLHTGLQLTYDGIDRRTHLVLPPASAPTPWPIVFALHGHGGSADQLLGQTMVPSAHELWVDLAAQHGLAVIIPDGLVGTDGGQGWHDCRADNQINPTSDDAGFLLTLADALASIEPVDPDRLWFTGTSNGAQMSLRMGLEHPDRTAGVAAVVSQLPADSECPDPDGTVPLLIVAGTDDTYAPFGGRPRGPRGALLSVPDSIATWVAATGASPSPSTTFPPDLAPFDNSTVQVDWHGGATPVALVTMHGAGHSEPSRRVRYPLWWEQVVGEQNHDVELVPGILSAFTRFGL